MYWLEKFKIDNCELHMALAYVRGNIIYTLIYLNEFEIDIKQFYEQIMEY